MSHLCQKSGQPGEATPTTHLASGILSTASGVMVKVSLHRQPNSPDCKNIKNYNPNMCKQEQLLDTSHPGSEGRMWGRARERGGGACKGVLGDPGGLRIRKGTWICCLSNPDGGTQSEVPPFHCRAVSVLAKPALSLRNITTQCKRATLPRWSSAGLQPGGRGLEPTSASPLLLREEGEPGGVELLPDALELLQEEPHILLVLHDEHVLPVVLNGLCGPVEGASDQHLPVHDGELVVHVAQVLVVPDLDPCKE